VSEIKSLRRIEKIFFPGWMVNRRVRITLLGWAYLGLIFIFGFSAINTGNNLLYLILGIMISLLLASFWLSEMAITDLYISRQLPKEIFAEQEFRFPYSLACQRKFFPTPAIEVKEEINGEKASVYFPLVPARSSQTAFARLKIKSRGRHKLKTFYIETVFPFGLFRKIKAVNLPDEIVVLPKPAPEKELINAGEGEKGLISGIRKGKGEELFGWREYFPGDNPHWIDWKASARQIKILIKETIEELEKKAIVLLNPYICQLPKGTPKKEALISRCAGLCKFLIEQGWLVRLEVSGRGIDFGAGDAQLKRILYFLALFDDPDEPFSGERLSANHQNAIKFELN